MTEPILVALPVTHGLDLDALPTWMSLEQREPTIVRIERDGFRQAMSELGQLLIEWSQQVAEALLPAFHEMARVFDEFTMALMDRDQMTIGQLQAELRTGPLDLGDAVDAIAYAYGVPREMLGDRPPLGHTVDPEDFGPRQLHGAWQHRAFDYYTGRPEQSNPSDGGTGLLLEDLLDQSTLDWLEKVKGKQHGKK